MKLSKHVPRNNTHVYTKSHNSGYNNYSVMHLFGLRNSYKKFTLAHYSKTNQHFQIELGTHVPRNYTPVFSKSYNSGFKTYSGMPLFQCRKKQKGLEFTP